MLELLLPPDIDPATIRPLTDGRPISLTGHTMGTGWRLECVAPQGTTPERLTASLEAAFASVIRQMSQWDGESELSRFNASEAGTTHGLSPQFAIVLGEALRIAEMSEGAFDPTLGGASDAWGFGPSPAPLAVPDDEVLTRTRDWGALTLEENRLTQPGGIRLDLSGIAKGFAVDMALAVLRRQGIEHALLEIGGELAGIGVQQDGLPWWVDIERPPRSAALPTRIALTGWAVATSGHYHRRREADGQSWSHSLHPGTGRPVNDELLAVTVLDKLCMRADALATAIAVLGPQSGMAFAEWHDIPARIVLAEATHASTTWRMWQN